MENKDLVLTTNDITKEIIKKDGRFNAIITKAGDPNALVFKTIDDKKMQEIAAFMPEANRAVAAFSKQNSQTTSSLMTLGMLESGPYRVLRQILAQIEKKRGALKENIYNLEEKKVEYKRKTKQLASLAPEVKITIDGKQHIIYDEEDVANTGELLQLKMDKIASDIVDATSHIEAALKELGAYKERYHEVCKNNNIKEGEWNEQDFEDAEVEHHIKSMFRNAIRDRMQGSHNMGTMEYFEQFGINPIMAYSLVDRYIGECRKMMGEGRAPNINAHYEFFDQMYHLFKNEYILAMKRLGLDSIQQADFLMKENA